MLSKSTQTSEYDCRKRDPLYANADDSPLWELSVLVAHYHPTVQLYAQNLTNAQSNVAKPDLSLHTIKHFVDRFVYRNPKVKPTTRGSSIMQPFPNTSLILGIRGNAEGEKTINSEEWWARHVHNIQPDEVFFHKFFVAKEEQEVKSFKKRKRTIAGEDGELNENEIWEALIRSSKVEGGFEDPDVDGESDGSVDWSDSDEGSLGDMNEGFDDASDGMSDLEMDDDADLEVGEDDADSFFDDEAEQARDREEIQNPEAEDAEDSFGFEEEASDIVGSDEEVNIPVSKTTSDRKKKRKLRDLPAFASVEEYAHLLDN